MIVDPMRKESANKNGRPIPSVLSELRVWKLTKEPTHTERYLSVARGTATPEFFWDGIFYRYTKILYEHIECW
jgi:hypothetical protein